MEHIKSIILWVLIICGLSCHTITDCLPLFWSADIAIDNSGTAPQAMLVVMASLTYLFPIIGILLLLYCKNRYGNMVNLILVSIMAVFNVAHACLELFPTDNMGQYVIMPSLIIVSAILWFESFKLLRAKL